MSGAKLCTVQMHPAAEMTSLDVSKVKTLLPKPANLLSVHPLLHCFCKCEDVLIKQVSNKRIGRAGGYHSLNLVASFFS